ncbi:MAG: nucleotidyl transferase AbiEii/AbiGii toxin family protein [bacterium]|nr:nucleotidyl transferase AbiEii/AbiGii toxin family protein [bacterium]
MLIDNLRQTVEANKSVIKPLYLRNLLKEELQNYILNFIYNSKEYKELIFTGGTCLRKIYGLPRLSEDLDFDFLSKFSVSKFADDLKKYFWETLQYKQAETKISGNGNTVFIKLPVLKSLGFSNEEVLFVRCDFSEESLGSYKLETSSLSTRDFTFFVRNYNLETLFANKIRAFLNRDFFNGDDQEIPFKARDVFDLVWFLEKAKKSDRNFTPNWKRLECAFPDKSRNEVLKMVLEKVKNIKESEIKKDLEPFIESSQSVEAFSESFKEIIKNGFEDYLK